MTFHFRNAALGWLAIRIGRALLPGVAFLAHPLVSAAQTECPTAADLETGIRFTLATGETETFKSISENVVSSVFLDASPDSRYRAQYVLVQGLYVKRLLEFDGIPIFPTFKSETAFDVPEEELPIPEPDKTWSVTNYNSNDGGQAEKVTGNYVAGALNEMAFGDCTYAYFPIEARFSNDGSYVETMYYFADIGISYIAATKDADGTATFDYVRIEAPQ